MEPVDLRLLHLLVQVFPAFKLSPNLLTVPAMAMAEATETVAATRL